MAISGRIFDNPSARSKYRARAKFRNPVRVENGPAGVDDRRFIGHWEGDAVIQGHKQSGLVTLVERRSGYLLAARLSRISAELTKSAMIRLLKPRRGAVQNISLDNVSEFASRKAMVKVVTAATFFFDHYCSGQRGSNDTTRHATARESWRVRRLPWRGGL